MLILKQRVNTDRFNKKMVIILHKFKQKANKTNDNSCIKWDVHILGVIKWLIKLS